MADKKSKQNEKQYNFDANENFKSFNPFRLVKND